MGKLPAIALILGLLSTPAGYAQLNQDFVLPLSDGYLYQFVKANSPFIGSFFTLASDPTKDPGTGWQAGKAAFGTLNNTGAPPCPLNLATRVRTFWPSSRDLLVRKHLTLPKGAHNLKVTVSLDNAVQAWFNGHDISGGIKTHNLCATESGDYTFPVNDDFLRTGENVIALRGVWLSSKNYLDMKVTGDIYYTITVKAGTNGTITPAGPVRIYPGQTTLPTFSISANQGYRLDRVVVDGVSKGAIASYTFQRQDLSTDHTIEAVFVPDRYTLTVNAAANGYVTKSPDLEDYALGTVVTLTAYTYPGFHFSGWSGDLTGPDNPNTITMDRAKSITPQFTANNFQRVDVTPLTEEVVLKAIQQTNDNPGPDEIYFPAGGTIALSGPLPVLTDEVKLLVANGQMVTFQPSSSFPGDPASNIFELSGVFLKWGYTPQQTTISGFTITGFPGAGVCIQSNRNVIQGCIITYNDGDGIYIEGGSDNLIGGTSQGEGNTIAFNGGSGISIRGTNGQQKPSGNGIFGNLIYDNDGLGIDLGTVGVTPNVYPPGPSAPNVRPGSPPAVNYGQNFPVLFGTTLGSGSVVQGSLLNWPNTDFRIEIFADDAVDPSGHGEGKVLVASQPVKTDGVGYVWFEIPATAPLSWGQYVTATATDLTGGATNTSEFSESVPAGVTTKKFGTGYVVNTTFSGIPLHWPDGQTTYMVSASVPTSPADFAAAVNRSFATWSELSGTFTDGTPWSLEYTNGGTTTSTQFGGTPDGINNVVWITSDWMKATGADPNVIGLTRVRYNAVNGEMTDVDIALNVKSSTNPGGFEFDNSPVVDDYGRKEDLYRDVENLITHEAGHFSGLGDLYNPGYAPYVPMMGAGNDEYTMYGLIRGNETIKRSLTSSDKDGIAWIYEHAPQGHIELMLVFDGSATFVSQYGALDAAKFSAAELIQRMDAGDKVGVIQLPNTVVSPLRLLNDAASRQAVVTAIMNGVTEGGSSNIGAGLQAGLTQLQSSVGGLDAMILFSAGEETGVPAALSVVPSLASDSVRLFTLGFAGSTGQDLNSKLADTTGGAYFLVSSATMSTVTKEIWNRLTALQMIAYLAFPSDQQGFNWQGGFNYQGGFNWQGGFNYQGGFNWQGGFNYQGAVDDGTLKILPGFNWQGSSGLLALVPPQTGFVPPTGPPYTIPYGTAVITPDNWDDIPVPNQFFTSIKYIMGATYAFYEIVGPKPGVWTLIPGGIEGNPDTVEMLNLSIVGLTDVVMEAAFSRSIYQPGSVIQMQVHLSQGGMSPEGVDVSGGNMINDATVSAEVWTPGLSTPNTIFLTAQGNGLYTGTFENTSVSGTYDFRFLAEGKVTVPGPSGSVRVNFRRIRAQSVYVAFPFVPDAVLAAETSVMIDEGSTVKSGSVLVVGAAGTLTVGPVVSTPARYALKANKIVVNAGAVVASDVYYNTLINSGTIGGSLSTPLDLHITLPKPETVTPGKTDVILANGERRDPGPDPGAYRDLIMSPQSVLALKPGVYTFRSVWVKSGAQLLFTGKTQVKISAGFRPDNGSYVGPKNGSTITEVDILISVAAKNFQSSFSTAVNIGPQARFYGNIVATNGTTWIQNNSFVTGAFVSKDILLGKVVEVNLKTAFTGLLKSGEGWALAPELRPAVEEIPAEFSLSQNYPNPFNPATQIRYGLPVQSFVTIAVYNILGQEVARLLGEIQPPGYHEVQWDGRNQLGASVGSGIYFLRLTAGEFVNVRKMILMR